MRARAEFGGKVAMAQQAERGDAYSDYGSVTRAHRKPRGVRSRIWRESSLTTPLGAERGMDSSREHDRIYRATMQAMADGFILGKGRHGVVVALTNDPADPRFSLAVKIVSKVFVPSRNREGSFHRVVSHTLHVQNEVAAMAKLSAESTFVLPLYCAMQDDAYVYLVMERACCSLKQLIQHSDESEERQLLAFQEEHALKFLAFSCLTSASLLHACWTLQRAHLIHHDIHPAQVLVTSHGRPCLADLGQCSVIPPDGRKQLLPPLGRRDFCRPAKLGPLQGAEVDGYGCGATLWVTWKGCYDALNRVTRDWNRFDERETLQARLEELAQRALNAAERGPPPRWPFAQRLLRHLQQTSPERFGESIRAMIEELVTACQEEPPPAAGGGQPRSHHPHPAQAPVSSFTVEGAFRTALPFLKLAPALATDPTVALEPTNFALPAVKPEEPWPPAEANMVHPVYLHAKAQLRTMELAVAEQRSRSRAMRPELPELPIPLNAEPCVSMMLHPGRILTCEAEPMIRIAVVSMLVRDALPDEIPFTVRAMPWTEDPEELPFAGLALGEGRGGNGHAPAAGATSVITFSIYRDEFTQEGPSGPIEAKRILLLKALPHGRLRVTFELPPPLVTQIGFCLPPPLLLEHRRDAPADPADAALRAQAHQQGSREGPRPPVHID